ncbi:hypothetical protein [Microbacterium sp. K24]|uniref:hypothetical protein n=1 Tax=Microbacterium sp. K24 TaxID=2305446 RepID=UPI001F0EC8B4|nr:hypothetical protein [Microbacterium sp. K24]
MDGAEAVIPEAVIPEAEVTAELTADARAALAARVEAVVRATPGVRNVYRSGSLISNLLRAGAAALGTGGEGGPIVSVASGADGIAVEASLGLDVHSHASAVLHSAYAAIDTLLRAEGLVRESITLTVVYVQSREAA